MATSVNPVTAKQIMTKVNRLCGLWQEMGARDAMDRDCSSAGAKAESLEKEIEQMLEDYAQYWAEVGVC